MVQRDKLTFHQVAGMAISLTTSYVGHSSDLIIDTRCSWIVLLHCLWKTWWLLARLELTTYSSWREVLSLTLPHSLIRGSRSDPHNPRLCFSLIQYGYMMMMMTISYSDSSLYTMYVTLLSIPVLVLVPVPVGDSRVLALAFEDPRKADFCFTYTHCYSSSRICNL